MSKFNAFQIAPCTAIDADVYMRLASAVDSRTLEDACAFSDVMHESYHAAARLGANLGVMASPDLTIADMVKNRIAAHVETPQAFDLSAKSVY